MRISWPVALLLPGEISDSQIGHGGPTTLTKGHI